jgi:hypothetical protein
MKASILFLLLCVFLFGVFVGIWLDWRATKDQSQAFVYQLQPWGSADLNVKPGDSVTLVEPGVSMKDLGLDFNGLSPCENQNPSNPCKVRDGVATSSYSFGCDVKGVNGNACPDPVIQPSSSPPIERSRLWGAIWGDLGGGSRRHHPIPPGETESGSGSSLPSPPPPPPPQPVAARVGCLNGQTNLTEPGGISGTYIPVQVNQAVYWISPNFNLDTSKFPPGLCSEGDVGGQRNGTTKCTITMPLKDNVQYGVTAETTPNCSPLTAYLTPYTPEKTKKK